MIDEKKLAELQKVDWSDVGRPECTGYAENLMPELIGTIESLWKENARLEKLNQAIIEQEVKNVAYIQKLEAVARAAEAFIWDHKDLQLHDKLLEVWIQADLALKEKA